MDNSILPRFADVLQEHVHNLQASLVSLCESIHAEISVPYPLSKRLGIDKNLTWKASRILQAKSAPEALKHIPGKNGRELFLNAFRRAGAPEGLIEAVSTAVHALEHTVQLHIDDKETLELVLDGIPNEDGELLEASRHLAFRGNSGVWGVQARTRLTTVFLAPSNQNGSCDEDAIDLVLIAGFQRFRRLRESTPWPILRLRSIDANGKVIAPTRGEPIDPDGVLDAGPSLLTHFSSTPRPRIRSVHTGSSLVLELEDGPIGNPGAVDLIFGERRRAFASRWASVPGEVCEQQTDINVPVEFLLFDLLLHKDLPGAQAPEFQLLGRLGRDLLPERNRHDDHVLPIHSAVTQVEATTAALKTDLFPRYPELLSYVTARCDWNLADFRVLRVTLRYPPAPTTAVLSYPLPEKD